MVENTVLEKLTNSMVHDVRTPLTILYMLCDNLRTYLPKVPEMQEDLRILQEEAEKIHEITTNYRETLRKLMEA